MSDGFVTVAQCVEGLPVGRTVWEALICAFFAWFLLGVINEPTPMAFSFLPADPAEHEWVPSREEAVLTQSAALAFGSFLAILVGGCLADLYGRLNVIRPALLCTICGAMLVQLSRTFAQAVASRFILGLASGSLFGVIPPLIAELLPSRHRGLYLTIWCSGWPLGSMAAIASTSFLPGLNWRALHLMILVPAMMLYVFIRAEMLPESPRYLYLSGRRDEGYITLVDMYEKQMIPLPWNPEAISVTSSKRREPLDAASKFNSMLMSENALSILLAVVMFSVSAAAQSMKLWMPTMLVAEEADAAVAPGRHMHRGFAALLQADPKLGFASGPKAVSMLSMARAPLMLRQPNYTVILMLLQGYVIELVGIVILAYLSTKVCRKSLIQWALLAATFFTLVMLGMAESGFIITCGPLLGAQLAAQATALNFLQAFASEHFPTSRRAKTTAFVSFAAQLGNFTIPVVGGSIVRRVSAAGAVIFFSVLYVVGWILSHRLPLPVSQEEPLHDVEEEAPPKKKSTRAHSRKRDLINYHAC
mmetsp:Transcript_125176/g.227002  ORF Transcript_125176/g.227002 Transcript_125176/m.227002 type:complete len:532 (-) Transcript_125176:129-1724(-)